MIWPFVVVSNQAANTMLTRHGCGSVTVGDSSTTPVVSHQAAYISLPIPVTEPPDTELSLIVPPQASPIRPPTPELPVTSTDANVMFLTTLSE